MNKSTRILHLKEFVVCWRITNSGQRGKEEVLKQKEQRVCKNGALGNGSRLCGTHIIKRGKVKKN